MNNISRKRKIDIDITNGKKRKKDNEIFDVMNRENISFDDKVQILNAIDPRILKNVLVDKYSDPIFLATQQHILEKFRHNSNLKSHHKTIMKELPFMVFVPNVISLPDVTKIKKYTNDSNQTFKALGDERKYYFSESYQVYYFKNKLCVSPIHIKGSNSPPESIDNVIQKLCRYFYSKLSEHDIEFGNQRQLNVFLVVGNTEQRFEQHLRWHRDADEKNIPTYSMVVLLDEPKWKGGNLLCQYTGEKANVYRKEPFDTPIIKFVPQFRGALILRNIDTRHMVDKISLKNNSSTGSNKTRMVMVLQLYKKMYAYDKVKVKNK